MKRSVFTVCSITAILLFNQPVSAEAIKLGTLAPQNSPYYDILRDLAESWAKLSDGKFRFRIYAGGVAGDDPDMVRKMRIGQLDAALLAGSGLYEIAPEIKAIQMPMMFSNDEEWDHVATAAALLVESAHLMTAKDRAVDTGEWLKMAQAMAEASTKALTAARAKSADGVFDVGAEINRTCDQCHDRYRRN